MPDTAAEAIAIRREIAASLRRSASLVRIIVGGFAVMGVLLVAILIGVILITADTNRAVERQVVPLQHRVADLEEQVAVQEDLLEQSTDAIVLLIGELRAAGITPPEIVIRPPDEGG